MAQVSPYVPRPVDPDEAVLWDVMRYAVSLATQRGLRVEAQDIAQDVALRYWRLRDSIRLGHWQPWVHRVTLNRIADHTRSAAYRRSMAAIPLHLVGQPDDHGVIRYPERMAAIADDILEQVEERMLLTAVYTEMRRLTDVYRTALVCHAIGYGMQETAAMVGVPEGTVKSRLFYGRKQVRKWVRQRLAM